MEKCMGKVYINGLMEINTKDNISKTINKVMAFILGLMEANTKANGSMMKRTVKESIEILTVSQIENFGFKI
jgi:hypothetical protein